MTPEYNDRCVWAYDIGALAKWLDCDWSFIGTNCGRQLYHYRHDDDDRFTVFDGTREAMAFMVADESELDLEQFMVTP